MNRVIPDIKYKLHVVQNPIRARCCGFGEKDKRPIDPPPILKLTAENENGDPIRLNVKDVVLFLVHCQLYNENGEYDRASVHTPWSTTNNHYHQQRSFSDKPDHVRNLIGSVVSNAYHLYDENNIPGIYFVFQDLSIRLEDTYTLKFIFINLEERDQNLNTKVQIETYSKPFTVYSAKKFPGMTESTTLSRCFAKQGIKIPIRRPIQKPAFNDSETITSENNNRITHKEINTVSHKLSIKNFLLSTSDNEEGFE